VDKVYVCAKGAKGTVSVRSEHQRKDSSQVLASLHRDPEEDPRAEEMCTRRHFMLLSMIRCYHSYSLACLVGVSCCDRCCWTCGIGANFKGVLCQKLRVFRDTKG